jgi:hypothetical protein
MEWNPVREAQKLSQPIFFPSAIDSNVHPGIGSTDHGTKGKPDDVQQTMLNQMATSGSF